MTTADQRDGGESPVRRQADHSMREVRGEGGDAVMDFVTQPSFFYHLPFCLFHIAAHNFFIIFILPFHVKLAHETVSRQ